MSGLRYPDRTYVDLTALDAECGEWRSVANLLMEAAIQARKAAAADTHYSVRDWQHRVLRYAESCERVATLLSEERKS